MLQEGGGILILCILEPIKTIHSIIVAKILPLTKLGFYAQDPFGFCAAAAL